MFAFYSIMGFNVCLCT